MATAQITEEYPITHDPTRAPVPFGRWAPELLTRWLNTGDVHEKQRTLFTLCDFLHDPEQITACLATDLVPALCRQLEHTDATVRQKAALCLGVICGHAVGREDLLKNDVLTHLSWRFTDAVPLVRRNVHQVVVSLLRTPEGVSAGLEVNLTPLLLQRVVCELPEIVLLCLRSLQPLLKEDPKRGLLLGAVRTMNKLLRSEISSIRACAASCLHNLCRPTQGKNEATVLGSIPLLVTLLKDWDPAVRTQAAAALGSVLVTTPAKKLAVTLPTLRHLLDLAGEFAVPAAQMLAIQALAVLAAHPEARNKLREHVEVFEEAMRSEEEGVRVCAKRAMEEVMWVP
ncbi:radial spoke head 14 homolog [Amphibalanus amphitrite]|uniref:radial spoke head 14 homolog n=1 Tax=Amphibalanus amphitrite TaxID=1232801 RepID=UPI001C90B70A|nr:radial spoke head 14 homolog [Amphibalanus amphitrite]